MDRSPVEGRCRWSRLRISAICIIISVLTGLTSGRLGLTSWGAVSSPLTSNPSVSSPTMSSPLISSPQLVCDQPTRAESAKICASVRPELRNSQVFYRTLGPPAVVDSLQRALGGVAADAFPDLSVREFHRCVSDRPSVRNAEALCPCSCQGSHELETFRGRKNSFCRLDNTLERHRIACTLFAHSGLVPAVIANVETTGRQTVNILHVATEYSVGAGLIKMFSGNVSIGSYVGGDFTNASQYAIALRQLKEDYGVNTRMMKFDLTKLRDTFDPGSIDLLLCSHVLEHVPDDLLAMKEMYAVMRPGAFGLINVPYSCMTVECPPGALDTKEDRIRYFGQHDHIRSYSPDTFVERLASVGFAVVALSFDEWIKTTNQWGVLQNYTNVEFHTPGRGDKTFVVVRKPPSVSSGSRRL